MPTTPSHRRAMPSRPGLPPAGPPQRRRGPWLVAAGALAAITILVLALGNEPPADDGTQAQTAKPNVHVGFFIERGGAIWPGRPGEIVRPGDTIQFTTTTDVPGFVAVLSVSPDGQVDVLYPEGRKAAAVPAGREVGLPAEHDPRRHARTGTDRRTVLQSSRRARARSTGSPSPTRNPPPPAGCQTEVFTWNKRAP